MALKGILKDIAADVRKDLGITTGNCRRAKLPWDYVLIELEPLLRPSHRETAYAILYAVKSGRLHALAERSITRLNAYHMVNALVLISENNRFQNDVPRWINEFWRLIEKQA